MASIIPVPGPMEKYISKIEFSLNFEDRKKSTKVRIGDAVFFDGVTAKHTNRLTGEECSGRALPLKSAIANNWLTLNGLVGGPTNVRTEKVQETVPIKNASFNTLSGGDFDGFIKHEGITTAKYIKEEDQVIKKTDFTQQSFQEEKSSKREVSGDQIDVRAVSSISVSNSTSVNSTQKTGKRLVIQSDDGHAERIIPSRAKVGSSAPEAKPKVNSFTVDGSTSTIPEDATLKEVRRAVAPAQFDESQDARVVKRVGAPRMAEEPTEQEGVVLKKTPASSVNSDTDSQGARIIGKVGTPKMASEPVEQEGIVLKKTSVFTNKKASGSTPVMDLSGITSQADVDSLEKTFETETSTPKYADILPENWPVLHWTKKEKFVLQISDVEFLKYLLIVEHTKAVTNACRKRMAELEKQLVNG